ncbi:Vps62-related protein [Pseudobdellovibrio exovorus]|uniref:Uncharacterized protein n=1 Tax=Pseudobdellovibrio exovorus JSS TaxID=1184267 RepID=M4VB96_9BACT|nr:Vps62-related protein [Pseudobdellovibrio exovorus]AGH96667.1 hypothetical protein A11Q_2451 [Pseudobdellovibrio exovorus JSS]
MQKIKDLTDAQLEELAKKFSPAIYFHSLESFFPCSIEHLLKDGTLRRYKDDGKTIDPSFERKNLKQEDLAEYSHPNFFVDINSSQFPGMYDKATKTVKAPMYYVIRRFENAIEIVYPLLYANQGGQTVIADRVLSSFHCILHSYGEHQGDLECVTVRLAPKNNDEFYISEVMYEAHGNTEKYSSGEFYCEGTHPVAYASLNGHGTYNGLAYNHYKDLGGMAGFVIVTDLLDNKGPKWRPWQSSEFKQLRLTDDMGPTTEHWVKFKGRLGAQQKNTLLSATYLDGTKLNEPDWYFVDKVDFLALLINKLPKNIRDGNGPSGLGNRDYMQPVPAGATLPICPENSTVKTFLFGIKGNDEGWISVINNDATGWRDIYKSKWSSRYVGNAVTSFKLNGHPYIFALRLSDEAFISRINDDGKGWTDIYKGKWSSNYVAIRSFELKDHPYLFALKGNNEAYISRINDDGKGWTDIYKGKWDSNYVGSAITTFMLNGHPHIFALKNNDVAYISRINDDGKGWTDIYKGKWSSRYVAIKSFELNGHPYLFALRGSDEAFITRINDDGKGWVDVYKGKWSSNYVGTAIAPFKHDGQPHIFALKRNSEGWISRINEDGRGWVDLCKGAKWSSDYVAVVSYELDVNLAP